MQPQSAEETPRAGLEAPNPCLALLCPARGHPTLKPTSQLLLRERNRSQNLLRDITSTSRKEPSESAACISKARSVWLVSPGNKGGEELDSFVFVAFTVKEALVKCAQHVSSTPVYVGHSHMTYIITLPNHTDQINPPVSGHAKRAHQTSSFPFIAVCFSQLDSLLFR